MSDNISLEPLFNDSLSTASGLNRKLNISNINDIFEGYIASNVDETDPNYYGFEDADGNWIIMKETIAGDLKAYTFAKGVSGYATAWTNRATQSYDTVSNTF